MHRLYDTDSSRRRVLRLLALYSRQPEVEVTREQEQANSEEWRSFGTNEGEHEIRLEQQRLRDMWVRDLEQRRRDELDQIPDPMVAQAGMLGALRATLFREPRVETIPPALRHPDIVRAIIHDRHGWLIPTFQASLTRYADAENEEYIAACVTLGQPIVRDVRRLLDGALEQLLVHHILTIIRDGRIPRELLQRALTDETGLIDFITQRDGRTMESLANPTDLTNLATNVSRRYLVNIGFEPADVDFRDRYIASAQAEDERVRRVEAVVVQRVDAERGSRGEIMRLTDYRQETRYERLTEEDIERRRPRPIGTPVEPIRRVAPAPPSRPLREEVVELSQVDFNVMMRDNQCPICLCDNESDPLTVACRHPTGSGTDICRQAYHNECFESMKMSQGRYFHCSRCFVGKPNGLTSVVTPFRLLFRVNPMMDAETEAMPAAMAPDMPAAMAPDRPLVTPLADRRAAAALAAERRLQEQRERDVQSSAHDDNPRYTKRRGGKRRKTNKK
jgi:hypothetical protein